MELSSLLISRLVALSQWCNDLNLRRAQVICNAEFYRKTVPVTRDPTTTLICHPTRAVCFGENKQGDDKENLLFLDDLTMTFSWSSQTPPAIPFNHYIARWSRANVSEANLITTILWSFPSLWMAAVDSAVNILYLRESRPLCACA